MSSLTAKLSLSDLDSMISNAGTVNGVKVITAKVVLDSPKTLRDMGDKIRDKLGSGIVVLGGEYQGKAALLAMEENTSLNSFVGEAIRERISKESVYQKRRTPISNEESSVVSGTTTRSSNLLRD